MSCGCEQPDPNPCDPAITSPESVSSQLTNLTSQLFGSVTKTIVNGRFVWSPPCAASLPFNIYGVTPNVGEGMLCYIIRALKEIPGVAAFDILVFANDAERAATAPKYIGQPGIQEDTKNIYIAGGTTAGDWDLFNLALANIPAALFTADVAGRAKFANGFITAALIAAGTFTADVTGRGKFANGFVDAALLATDSVETLKIVDLAVTAAKLATILDLSGKTLTMPVNHWRDIAPAGSVLQTLQQNLTAASTVTATMPSPGPSVTPTSSQGTQIMSVGITPQSASNKVRVQGVVIFASNGFNCGFALFRGSTCIHAVAVGVNSVDYLYSLPFDVLDSPNTTGAITYTLRCGNNAAPTYVVYINSNSLGTFYATTACTMTLQEIKG